MSLGKILIVEDQVMLAKELVRGLEKAGYQVVGRVTTGQGAVRSAEETQPDLILMDIKLEGEMDGIEASALIRSRLDTAIIYLTAHTAADVFERAKSTEPYAYLTKPVSLQELGRTVEMALYKRRMDRRLKESEQKYRSLYSAMNEGVALHEIIYNQQGEPADYRILDINPAYETITGLSEEQAVGSLASELYGTGSPPFLREYVSVAETGEPYSFEFYWAPMEKHFSTSVFSPARGRFATIFEDITGRKIAEQALAAERERLAVTLRAIGDAVISTDTKGRVLSLNKIAEELTGYREEEALGKEIEDVFHIIDEKTRRRCENPVEKVLRTGHVIGLANHTILVGKDRAERALADSGAPIFDKNGETIGVVLVFRDITEEKHSERLLHESEERFRLAMEATNDGVWDWNVRTGDVYRSPAFYEMLGYRPKEFPWGFDGWKGSLCQEDAHAVLKSLNDYLSGRSEEYEVEFRIVTKSGETKWILSRGKVVEWDEEGYPLRMIGTHTDTTERKRFEQSLKRYSKMLEAQNLAHKGFLDELDRHRLFDGLLKSLLRLTESEYGYIGEVFRDHDGEAFQLSRAISNIAWTPDLKKYYEENWQDGLRFEANETLSGRVIANGEPIISNHPESDPRSKGVPKGHPRIASFMGLPIYKGNTLVGTLGVANRAGGYNQELADYLEPYVSTCSSIISAFKSDMERKRAEEALRESETRYRTLFERAGDGIILVDIEGDRAGNIVSANQVAADMHGYEMDEFLTLRMSDLDTPEEISRMGELFSRVRQDEIIKTEHFHKKKDGTVLSIELSAGLIEMDGHKYSLSINRDITERKNAEAERLLLATAIEQAAESVEITDADGKIVYVNPAFEKTTGYHRSEIVGQKPGFLASGEHDEAFYREMWGTIRNGEVWIGKLVNKRKDGNLFEEEVTISPVRDESGRSVNYVAVKRDVTNEVLLQKQLVEAQKMEAVGTLAGGIAHDFNNLLQIINGFAEMALFTIKEGQRGYSELNEIRRAAGSAAELTQGLLTFSRRVESKLRPVDLNQELKRLTKMLTRTLPKMIQIKKTLAEPLHFVNADSGQLQQVVMNLGRERQRRDAQWRHTLHRDPERLFGGEILRVPVGNISRRLRPAEHL